MATFVDADPDLMNISVFGQPHPNTVTFLQNTYNSVVNTIANVSSSFMNAIQHTYDRYVNPINQQALLTAARNLDATWSGNLIRPLTTVGQLQTAPLVMQRYIMAVPEIRRDYHDGMCSGYAKTYHDIQPGVVGEQHYDYRRVMNGIGVEVEDGIKFSFYPDELIGDDVELNIYQQADIIASMAHALSFHNLGEDDVTCVYGGSL